MKCALVSYWHDIEGLLPELMHYDKVFACEQAAYELLQHNVVLEKVISDFDSIPVEALEQLSNQLEVLPSRKNETDTTALFNYILAHFPDCSLTLYNEFSGRIDHALVLFSLYGQKPDLCIKTPQTEIYCVKPGTHFIENKQAYKYISFIALEEVANIELTHFQYPLSQDSLLPFCDLTVSNEFLKNKKGELFFTKGKLLCIYSKDV